MVLTAEAVASKGATAGLSAAHVARVAQAFVLEAPRRLAGALEALANAGMLSQAPAGFGGLELALGDAIAEPGTAGTIL
ncbi:MAG: hypothetical protein JWR40_662, partial [Massilia sp.]|nr:hypothetical protein [Massilia sp.]MDB5948325.1 hypothetical protein [Massilia sp.]